MPKIVDHRSRRTLIARALIDVAGERGLQAVSLRHVAEAAGVSVGMVQHYFRTKDEMMTFALNVVGENVQARLAQEAGSRVSSAVSPREEVRALLIEMLPLDDTRRREGLVGLAFHAYAAVHPHVADELRADTAGMQAFVADRIRRAQDAGDAAAGVRPEQEARALLALVEGLSLHVVGQGYAPADALAVFQGRLEAIFIDRRRATDSV